MDEQIDITVCMGSSCYTRGNSENLEYLEQLIEKKKLDIKLELTGSRCENKCAAGPNIIINGKVYNNVTKKILKQILSEYSVVKTGR